MSEDAKQPERQCAGCGDPLPDWMSGDYCSYMCSKAELRYFKQTGEIHPDVKREIESLADTGPPPVTGFWR